MNTSSYENGGLTLKVVLKHKNLHRYAKYKYLWEETQEKVDHIMISSYEYA